MKVVAAIHHRGSATAGCRWLLPIAAASAASLLLLLLLSTTDTATTLPPTRDPLPGEPRAAPTPPRLAYLISGSAGDGEMLKRALMALYHPRNQYALHLELEAPTEEREGLLEFVASRRAVFAGSVRVIARSNPVTYKGPTMVANTLHAAAILLREGGDWDWFINLSATDYPLVTQDDLLHVFGTLPRGLNFIEHTSNIGWKEDQRAKPIIIDPGLYENEKKNIIWVSQKRSLPTRFKLFTGSAWTALSRSFVEYCIWGYDNLPRTLLMYYANFISSPEGYFHTVICNTPEFSNTTVNHDLHFISWDNPPNQHPRHLTVEDMRTMVDSSAPFARKFPGNDPVLDKIDEELLSRRPGMLAPGGWCAGPRDNGTDPCLVVGNVNDIKPGPGAARLGRLMAFLLSEENFQPRQCK